MWSKGSHTFFTSSRRELPGASVAALSREPGTTNFIRQIDCVRRRLASGMRAISFVTRGQRGPLLVLAVHQQLRCKYDVCFCKGVYLNESRALASFPNRRLSLPTGDKKDRPELRLLRQRDVCNVAGRRVHWYFPHKVAQNLNRTVRVRRKSTHPLVSCRKCLPNLVETVGIMWNLATRRTTQHKVHAERGAGSRHCRDYGEVHVQDSLPFRKRWCPGRA